ncbi:MAG: IS21 family transposase, partial [Clostridia bacterium]|nr:IS21 family transposase [Clostridia bacterium]
MGSDLTFRYDAVKYSLPIEYVGKTVTLRVFPYEVEAWHKGVLAYRHSRPFAKGENRYVPGHYLPLLEMRPRAVRNAAPLKLGVMPPELDKFRDKCTDKDKFEQLANILLLARETSPELVLEAVDRANKTGAPSLNKVRFFLDLEKLPGNPSVIDPVVVVQH